MKKKTQNCYCHLKDDAVTSISKEIPEGYCCLCSKCNKPGHIRFDSSGTMIYALCDQCYQMNKAMRVVKIFGFIVLVVLTFFLKK